MVNLCVGSSCTGGSIEPAGGAGGWPTVIRLSSGMISSRSRHISSRSSLVLSATTTNVSGPRMRFQPWRRHFSTDVLPVPAKAWMNWIGASDALIPRMVWSCSPSRARSCSGRTPKMSVSAGKVSLKTLQLLPTLGWLAHCRSAARGPVIGCRAAFLMQLYCHNEVPTKSNTNIVTSPTSLSSRRGSNIMRDLPDWVRGADVSTRSRPSFQSLSPEMCLCGAVCNAFVRMVHTKRPFQVCSVSFECLVSPSARVSASTANQNIDVSWSFT